ncbi:hypothetical protein niasHT_033431 [Heterodera trifolii]|uniref:CCHC-type domain-containing protein n=1 Tax=Heterodera trifolii TaxID=157864 RepID=A0ABD2I434_9BILA
MAYYFPDCWECGMAGHVKADCPDAVCVSCKRTGHWVQQCLSEAAAKCCVVCTVRQHKSGTCWVLAKWVKIRIRAEDCSLLEDFVLRRAAETAAGGDGRAFSVEQFCVLCLQNGHTPATCTKSRALLPAYERIPGTESLHICGPGKKTAVCLDWAASDFIRTISTTTNMCFICFEVQGFFSLF